MSSPLIWLLVPLIISGIFLLFLNRQRFLKWIGSGYCLILAVLAAFLPVNQAFKFLFWELRISDELLVFGRRFILSDNDLPIMVLLFLICSDL